GVGYVEQTVELAKLAAANRSRIKLNTVVTRVNVDENMRPLLERVRPQVIQAGSAKVIRLRPAKVIRVRRPSTRSRVALEWSWGAARRGSGICGLLRTTRKEQSDMSAQRISMHRVQEMIRLHRAGGLTAHRIAKLLKMSRSEEH